MNDDDRIAYLAGDDNARLTPSERAELDGLRDGAGRSSRLGGASADLQERVVAAVTDTATPRRSRAFRYAVVGAAAAAVLAVGVAIGLRTTHEANRWSTPRR